MRQKIWKWQSNLIQNYSVNWILNYEGILCNVRMKRREEWNEYKAMQING